MEIEDNIFKKFIPDFKNLENYGFIKKNSNYHFEKNFKNNKFKTIIEISNDGKVKGNVYDLETDDEYLPLRVKNDKYTDTVRTLYEEILTDIREKCFLKNYFINLQSNRITSFIKEKYGDDPKFLWKKWDGYGVFKHETNDKWYGIIMNININKLEKNTNKETEIINLKIDTKKIEDLLKKKGFYSAYHMNKKNWISVILNDTLCDSIIKKLIDESYKNTIS